MYYTIIPTFDIEEAQIDQVWPKSQAILLMAERAPDGNVHLRDQHRKRRVMRASTVNTREFQITQMRAHNPSRQAMKLSRAALAFRAAHAAIAVEMLLAIAYVWWCALSGRRGRLLQIASASLIGEGVLVAANGGDCPLGGMQERLGDPVPLFELVLSPRAAKRAVPTLGAITAAGLVLVVVRGRRAARACLRRRDSGAYSSGMAREAHEPTDARGASTRPSVIDSSMELGGRHGADGTR